jgi:hypothetical protein
VRERRIAAATHKTVAAYDISYVSDTPVANHRPPAPWPLRWLGEEGFVEVDANDSETSEEIENLKRLFPEAVIWRGFTRL